jgi:hypothetical protein
MISLLLLIAASMHSGGKISILILMFYGAFLLLKFARSKAYYSIVLITVSVVIAGLAFIKYSANLEFSIVKRNLSLDSIIEEEQGGRLAIYSELLTNRHLLLGEFPGFFESLSVHNTLAPESYLLQILIENGIVYLLVFLSFYYYIFMNGKSRVGGEFVWVTLALFPCLVVSHAFTDPVFFVFWGILMYLFIVSSKTTVISTVIPPLTTALRSRIN